MNPDIQAKALKVLGTPEGQAQAIRTQQALGAAMASLNAELTFELVAGTAENVASVVNGHLRGKVLHGAPVYTPNGWVVWYWEPKS